MRSGTGQIKTIDFRKCAASTAQRIQFRSEFCESLKSSGCCLLENTGVTKGIISAVRSASIELFGLSADFKNMYSGRSIYGQRGYSNFGSEKARLSSIADLKEFWMVGREGRSTQLERKYGIYYENKWPTAWVKAEAFKLVTVQLYEKLDEVSDRLMQVIARDIQEDEREFGGIANGGDSVLRLSHFPPPPPLNIERSNVRTDRDLLSLLLLDTEAQIWDEQGNLYTVPPSEDCILVVTGEMLENVTNGLYRASLHRIISASQNHDSEARLAISFFAHPRVGTDLSPRAYCIKEQGGSRYPTVLSGQFLEERLQEIYTPFLKAC